MIQMAATVVRLLACAALLAACAGLRAEDRVQAELDRVAKMTRAEQQAWLERLEQRAAQVAKQTLSPVEAAKQTERTQALLHQKMVTWKVLRGVLEDTESREAAMKAAEVAKAKPQAVKNETAKPQAAKAVVAKPQAVKKEPAQTQTVTVAKPVVPDVAKPQAVKVNVEELDARIAAANLALRELETDLDAKNAWTAAKLEPLLDRLKEVVVRYNDLGLYRDVLPKAQRADVAKLEAPTAAVSQLGALVVDARKRAKDAKFAGDDVERQAELTRLDSITHRLAELTGK
jgi:hypothetical protein